MKTQQFQFATNEQYLYVKEAFRATVGRLLPFTQVQQRFDIFHVKELRDGVGECIGYELISPACIHRNVGGQNTKYPKATFSLRIPSHQFKIGGAAHWPFEGLNPNSGVEPVFEEVADKIAGRVFGTKVLEHVHYGVIPGKICYDGGDIMFDVTPNNVETVLFYADQPMSGFAGFRRFDLAEIGNIGMVFMPIAQVAVLIA